MAASTSQVVNTAAAGRLARWSVGLLLAINMFNYIDRQVLSSSVSKIGDEFFPGQRDTGVRMGSLNTAFLWSYMLAAPLFGKLAERSSRWKLIALAVIGWSLASGASGLATTFFALWCTRLFVGVGEAAYGPAAPALLADLFPVERRGRVLAWFYMAIPVGSALGYALGGAVAGSFGWRWAFFIVVPPGVALGIASLFMPDPPRGAADAAPAAPHAAKLADYWLLLRTPSYVLNTAGMTALTFAIGGVSFWMPDYIHTFKQQPDLGQVTLIFGAITAVTGISATLLGGIVGDRLTKRYPGAYFLASGAALLLAFPFFLLTLWAPFPLAWIFIFATEFCLFFNTGPANAIIANVTHPSVRSTAFALNILMIHLLGDAISPPLIGWLSDRYDRNMNIGFSAVSVAIVVGAIFWLWGARYLAHDTALAPTRVAGVEK